MGKGFGGMDERRIRLDERFACRRVLSVCGTILFLTEPKELLGWNGDVEGWVNDVSVAAFRVRRNLGSFS